MFATHMDPNQIRACRNALQTARDRHDENRYALIPQGTRKVESSQLVAADPVELRCDEANAA
jgi:hypothetical protein